MHNLARKSLLIILLISFTAMTSGFLMFIHMQNVENQENHNHSECMICQYSLLSSKKAIIEPDTKIHNVELDLSYVQLHFDEIITSTNFHSTSSRAPPAI